MPIKFETLLARWHRNYESWARRNESLDDFIARMARSLVQTRRWAWLRQEVWARDKGICDICGTYQTFVEYELGHVVDRCIGGKDEIENLVVMCAVCNRTKPLHRSKAEYEQWKDGGALVSRLIKLLRGSK